MNKKIQPHIQIELYSKKTTENFILLLKVLLACIFASGIFSLIEWVAPNIYGSIELLDGVVSISNLMILVLVVVLGLRWIYIVHKDLQNHIKEYPISPGRALANVMIPIYNLWGVWDILSTMKKHFTLGNGGKGLMAIEMNRLITVLYVTWIFSGLVDRFIFSNLDKGVDPAIYFLSAVADAAFYFALMQLVITVKRNLAARSK